MTSPLFIIQNDPAVPPGIIPGLLEERGVSFRVIRPCIGMSIPAPEEAAAVIVLGGAMGAGDDDRYPFLREVKRVIRCCLDRDIPFLGICLGGQLLADALGGEVTPHSHGENGICRVTLTDKGVEDPLFAGIERNFVTYQWHDDSFDLPPGCLLLASSPDCPHQAFRHGACVYGVQFHPEVNAAIVEAWSGAVAREAGVLHDHLVDFLRAEEEYLVTARALFDNFLRIARLVP